jgi:hypothetical protein
VQGWDVDSNEVQGAPSFEEFARNKEKYLGRDDEKLSQADIGSHRLRNSNLVKKHVYEIAGRRCKNLEEVEREANNLGINMKDLDYRPEVIPLGGGHCDVLVKFVSKHERERRANW